jgi:adenylosuccinate synthase
MNLAIVGLQWGDEGKGKIVDILSREFDCVARYQGGHNAGHTVTFGKNRHVLHLVPSGIFHDGVKCVVGGGVVLDPVAFFEETDAITAAGIEVAGRLFVSNRCHLILPYHRAIEAAAEQLLGDRKIGTTSRGIGPAYEDKAGRRGLRVCDLIATETLAQKICAQVDQKNRILQALGSSQAIDPKPICDDYARLGERLRPFVVDTSAFLNE